MHFVCHRRTRLDFIEELASWKRIKGGKTIQETWRWFGPEDTVKLEQIVQAEASGIVTALDHIPTGEVWPRRDIAERKALLQAHNLEWSVVESVPVHHNIKLRTGNYSHLIDNYRLTLRNLGLEGITRVCYNFMPVVDWTRTNLDFELGNAASALRFEMSDFVAYDAFILQRSGAKDNYSQDLLTKAKSRFDNMDVEEQVALEKNIIAGLLGGEGSWNREGIRSAIKQFSDLGTESLRANLIAFLRDIIPTAEEAGVLLAIHPDDPPFPLFGLPRVVSTANDVRFITSEVSSPHNGLTMCAGSYGARGDNDLIAMVEEFADRIQFVHLRNIRREADGSFYESEHLAGDNDIVGLVMALLDAERGRGTTDNSFSRIPMRPDHGHAMGNEKGDANVRPGYSYTGRMKGLAELRGVIHTIETLQQR